jgi:hypothetical protein
MTRKDWIHQRKLNENNSIIVTEQLPFYNFLIMNIEKDNKCGNLGFKSEYYVYSKN